MCMIQALHLEENIYNIIFFFEKSKKFTAESLFSMFIPKSYVNSVM